MPAFAGMTTERLCLLETSNEQSLRLLSRAEGDHRRARAPLPRASGEGRARGTAKLRRGEGELDRAAQRIGRVQEERLQVSHQRADARGRAELRADAARIPALRR